MLLIRKIFPGVECAASLFPPHIELLICVVILTLLDARLESEIPSSDRFAIVRRVEPRCGNIPHVHVDFIIQSTEVGGIVRLRIIERRPCRVRISTSRPPVKLCELQPTERFPMRPRAEALFVLATLSPTAYNFILSHG